MLWLLRSNRQALHNPQPFAPLSHFHQAAALLFRRGHVLVILACSTVCAKSLRKTQQEWLSPHYFDRQALGVVISLTERPASMLTDTATSG